jgi:cytochrome c553
MARVYSRWVIGIMMVCGLSLSLGVAAQSKPKAAAAPKKAVAAAPAAPLGNAQAGAEKAESERCIECHGATGQGAGHGNGPEGKFAKLAGQHPAYILKQIREFRSGVRKHDQMAIMARSVSDEDVLDIAAYFAQQPAMSGDGNKAYAAVQQLYTQGDAARGIPACASCHGADGRKTLSPTHPVIGGQEWRYLDQQLRDWRSGERHNSPGGVMNTVAKPLTDAEIEGLANYLASLPNPL